MPNAMIKVVCRLRKMEWGRLKIKTPGNIPPGVTKSGKNMSSVDHDSLRELISFLRVKNMRLFTVPIERFR